MYTRHTPHADDRVIFLTGLCKICQTNGIVLFSNLLLATDRNLEIIVEE